MALPSANLEIETKLTWQSSRTTWKVAVATSPSRLVPSRNAHNGSAAAPRSAATRPAIAAATAANTTTNQRDNALPPLFRTALVTFSIGPFGSDVNGRIARLFALFTAAETRSKPSDGLEPSDRFYGIGRRRCSGCSAGRRLAERSETVLFAQPTSAGPGDRFRVLESATLCLQT